MHGRQFGPDCPRVDRPHRGVGGVARISGVRSLRAIPRSNSQEAGLFWGVGHQT